MTRSAECKSRHCRRKNMQVKVLKTTGHGLLAKVRVGNQILGVIDGFSMIRPKNVRNVEPEFFCLRLE